jgi:hypothetical protein
VLEEPVVARRQRRERTFANVSASSAVTFYVYAAQREDEFLFAPYSTFTVRAFEWSPQPSVNTYTLRPHYIDVDVASDNLRPPLDLPLAPWC